MAKNHLIVLSDHYLTFVKDQMEILSESFEAIHVFIPYNPLTELSRILPLRYLKQYREKNLVDSTDIPLNIHLHTIPLIYPPVVFQSTSFGDRYFHEIEAFIGRNDICVDLIHAHFTWPNGYAGARLKERLAVPLIITAHGYDIYDLPFRSKQWNQRITEILNTADHIITVSGKNQACIQNLHVHTSVSVIPNGFRRDLFFPRSASDCRKHLGLPDKNKCLVSIGNIVKEKGYSYLVDAVADLEKKDFRLRCYLIGRGPFARTLSRQIKRLGLEESITLIGGRPHHEIPLWIGACDAFVLPSLMEGNPTVMFECLGCGRPFIGTRVGGIPEVISSTKYGLLVDPGNPLGLSNAIQCALEKTWDQEPIVAYSEQFTWKRLCEKINAIYQSAGP